MKILSKTFIVEATDSRMRKATKPLGFYRRRLITTNR